MTASLRALVSHLIDYAGLYPPAELPLDGVLARYRRYRAGPNSWILNRLVLPASKLKEVHLEDAWRITLLVDADLLPLPPQVESLETKRPLTEPRPLGSGALPTYSESPLGQISNSFAKIRTGALTPEAIPSAGDVARFLHAAAARHIPFKATAGLHHAIRAEHPLTYAPDAPRAVMHGFLNVFVAAAFAHSGAEVSMLIDILEECDPHAFAFAESELRWRTHSLPTAQIAIARAGFAHSFGSCSFEEPVADLRQLGLLA